MKALLPIFGRGAMIVGLVALQTRFISSHMVPQAIVTSGAISWVWWDNARTSARSELPGARVAYALGASTGSLLALLIPW